MPTFTSEVPGGEDKEKSIENAFGEIVDENFPNLKKETDLQIQEPQRVPNKMNTDPLQEYWNENGKT